MNDQEIKELFIKWNNALKTGDPDKVVALYATGAILLPTVSNQVRHNHAQIKEYFKETFLPLGPQGTIIESNIRNFGDSAINSGIYTFTFTKLPDEPSVEARFTFVYRHRKIIEHHSSQMPEPR